MLETGHGAAAGKVAGCFMTSLSMIISKPVHVAADGVSLFFLMAEY